MGKQTWIRFAIDKEFYAPYSVKTDMDYYSDLRKRYSSYIKLLKKVQADDESIKITRKYSDKVCEALRDYYAGRISTCHQKVENLVRACGNAGLAVSKLEQSKAFPGIGEIQFFRARTSTDFKIFPPKEMLHLPFSKRSKTGNYRFSIPGVACLYLANSSYGCWIEMGRPSEHDFHVSPVVLNGEQIIFNLAVMMRDLRNLNDGDTDTIHCWLKLLVLMIATSYQVEEKDRTFRSEYIISQSIMLACKKLGYDGVAYYSKRVDDEMFSLAAINLALFAEYSRGREYGSICDAVKIDEAMNFQLFKQLSPSLTFRDYKLRIENTSYITNIGNYKYQYKYSETEFCRFDKHLFARWMDKDLIPWGNALIDQSPILPDKI